MYCLYVLLSFPFEVTELDADDAEDNAPPPPSSPAADFPAVTETINPVPKKNVTAKKTAAKSEPQSLNWVILGLTNWLLQVNFKFLFSKFTIGIKIKTLSK